MRPGNLVRLSLASAVVALIPSLGEACAVCLTGSGGDAMTDAFNWSVLFLMATPYLVVGSIIGWLAYTYRRAVVKRGENEVVEPAVRLVWSQKENEK